MSLINQMLRDLQQQKRPGGTGKPEAPRRKMPERIPFLPLPVVLGGAALVMVFLVWWLAGVLSDLMFGAEPTAKPAVSQQASVSGSSSVAEQAMQAGAEPDQLTLAERDAEPASALAVQAPVAENIADPVKVPADQMQAEVKAPVTEPPPVAASPAVPPVERHKQETKPKPVAKALNPIRSTPAPAPRKVAAASPKRLNPDDLPGAVLNSRRIVPENQVITRPSRIPATTPYGMAEEAYLDGKWALEQGRVNLAARSLQEALNLYPGHLPARELLVRILGKDGKSGEAMFLLAEGLDIAPDYIAFKKSYARLLADQGDYDMAIKVMLSGGLPTVEDDPEAYVVLANLYQRLGEPFLTAQTYRNLLVAWPQTGAFWVGLGSALEGQGLPVEAVECYRRALATKNLRQDLSRFAEKRLQQLN